MSDPERTFRAAEWLASLELCLESEGVDLSAGAWVAWLFDPRNAVARENLLSTIPIMKVLVARLPLPSDAECASDTYDGSISVADWFRTGKPRPATAATSVNASDPSSAAPLEGRRDTTAE
jgi:hypothetical protein